MITFPEYQAYCASLVTIATGVQQAITNGAIVKVFFTDGHRYQVRAIAMVDDLLCLDVIDEQTGQSQSCRMDPTYPKTFSLNFPGIA